MASTYETEPVAQKPCAETLDIYSVGEWMPYLFRRVSESVDTVLDLSLIERFDAAGLQLLVAAKREASRLGREFRLCNHSPTVAGLIELYGLSAWFGDPLVLPEPSSREQSEPRS